MYGTRRSYDTADRFAGERNINPRHHALAEIPRGGVLLRAPAEPVLARAHARAERAGSRNTRGKDRLDVKPPSRALGRAPKLRHRGRERRQHQKRNPERHPRAHRAIENKPRSLHGCDFGAAVYETRLPANEHSLRTPPLAQRGERAHAIGRSGKGIPGGFIPIKTIIRII